MSVLHGGLLHDEAARGKAGALLDTRCAPPKAALVKIGPGDKQLLKPGARILRGRAEGRQRPTHGAAHRRRQGPLVPPMRCVRGGRILSGSWEPAILVESFLNSEKAP